MGRALARLPGKSAPGRHIPSRLGAYGRNARCGKRDLPGEINFRSDRAGITTPWEMKGWAGALLGCSSRELTSTFVYGEFDAMRAAQAAVSAGGAAHLMVDAAMLGCAIGTPGLHVADASRPRGKLLYRRRDIALAHRVPSWPHRRRTAGREPPRLPCTPIGRCVNLSPKLAQASGSRTPCQIHRRRSQTL
jgi:hypothetical protein